MPDLESPLCGRERWTMFSVSTLNECARTISNSRSADELGEHLGHVCATLGIRYFALTQHPNKGRTTARCMRIHNYAPEWQDHYDRRGLGRADPVHRGSHFWACGFRWAELPDMIPFTPRDRAMLDEAETFDLGEGYTVPVNVPGELRGSVSFVTRRGTALPDHADLFLPALAGLAFQTARANGQPKPPGRRPLTDHQLDVIRLIGCDKSNWEIGGILSVREDTIKKLVQKLCLHYGVHKRTSLPLHAVREGLLCLTDLLP